MFRERISRNYGKLSPSFKRLADFILSQHQRAAFMSASRLAQHFDVDVATVTRFAQTLGYEGYTELIREIQEQVLEEMRQARAPISERLQKAEGPINQTLWQDWSNLEKTIAAIRPEVAVEAMAALKAARQVYLVSEGVGAGLASAMATYLCAMRPTSVVLDKGPFDVALELKALGPEDVVIGIGFTSYAYLATRVIEYARHIGARTIGIIAQAACPIGQVAELIFVGAEAENGYLPAPTSVAAILFSLVYGLYLTDVDRYNEELMRFQKVYAALTEGTNRGEQDVVKDLVDKF